MLFSLFVIKSKFLLWDLQCVWVAETGNTPDEPAHYSELNYTLVQPLQYTSLNMSMNYVNVPRPAHYENNAIKSAYENI